MAIENPTSLDVPKSTYTPVTSSPEAVANISEGVQNALGAITKIATFKATQSIEMQNELQAAANKADIVKYQSAMKLASDEQLTKLDATDFNTMDDRKRATASAIDEISRPFLDKITDPSARNELTTYRDTLRDSSVSHSIGTAVVQTTQKYMEGTYAKRQDMSYTAFSDATKLPELIAQIDEEAKRAETFGVIPASQIRENSTVWKREVALAALTGGYQRALTSNNPAFMRQLAEEMLEGDQKKHPSLKYLPAETVEGLGVKLAVQASTVQQNQTEQWLKQAEEQLKAATDKAFATGNPSDIDANLVNQVVQMNGDKNIANAALYALDNAAKISKIVDATFNQGIRGEQALNRLDPSDPRNTPLQGADYEHNKRLYESIKSRVAKKEADFALDPKGAIADPVLRQKHFIARGIPLDKQTNLTHEEAVGLGMEFDKLVGDNGSFNYEGFGAFLQKTGPLTRADLNAITQGTSATQDQIQTAKFYNVIATPENKKFLNKALAFNSSLSLKGEALDAMKAVNFDGMLETNAAFKGFLTMGAQDTNEADTSGFRAKLVETIKKGAMLEYTANPEAGVDAAITSAMAKLIPKTPKKVGGGYMQGPDAELQSLNDIWYSVSTNSHNFNVATYDAKTIPAAEFLVTTVKNPVKNYTAQEVEAVGERLNPLIAYTASKVGVSPALLKSILYVESKFFQKTGDKDTRSGSNAIGIGQMLQSTANELAAEHSTEYGVTSNLSDMKNAMMLSALYLRKLGNMPSINGDEDKIAHAYNAGPGNQIKGILPKETRDYIRSVKIKFAQYSASPITGVSRLSDVGKGMLGGLGPNMRFQPAADGKGYNLYVTQRDPATGRTSSYPVLPTGSNKPVMFAGSFQNRKSGSITMDSSGLHKTVSNFWNGLPSGNRASGNMTRK
jgi:soluble lytic murein transglycosylase-like protein